MSEWSPTEPLTYGFEKLKANPAGLILPVLVVAVLNGLPNGIFGGIAGALSTAGEDGGLVLLALASAVRLIGWAVGLVVSAFLTAGTMKLFLKAARGEPFELAEVFSGGTHFVQMLLTLFILQIVTGAGFVLCLVPGIIAMAGLGFAVPLVVDRDMPALDALKESWRMTYGGGNLVKVLVFGLLSAAASIAGLLFFCVGILAVAPVVALGHAWIYLKMIDDPAVADASPPPATF